MSEDANKQGGEQHEGQVEGAQSGAEAQVEGTNEGQQPGDSAGKPKEEPTITESALKQRLARARKKWDEEKAEEQRLAQLSAEERANAERDAALAAVKEREAKVDARLIQVEARTLAAELGIRQDRVAAAIKFADLSEVEVSEDGEPDADAIRTALSPVLEQFPEWGKPEVGKAPGNTNTGRAPRATT
jgi:hypothetical protein